MSANEATNGTAVEAADEKALRAANVPTDQ